MSLFFQSARLGMVYWTHGIGQCVEGHPSGNQLITAETFFPGSGPSLTGC